MSYLLSNSNSDFDLNCFNAHLVFKKIQNRHKPHCVRRVRPSFSILVNWLSCHHNDLHSFIHSLNHLSSPGSRGDLEPIAAIVGGKVGYTLNRPQDPYWRNTHRQTFTPAANLKSPVILTFMSLDCETKLEETVQAKGECIPVWTQDLSAMRWQY